MRTFVPGVHQPLTGVLARRDRSQADARDLVHRRTLSARPRSQNRRLGKFLQVASMSNIEDFSAPLGHNDHVSIRRIDPAASLAGLSRPRLVAVTDNLIMWRQEWSTPGSSRPMRSFWIFNRATGHVMTTSNIDGAVARLRLSRCYSPALFLDQGGANRDRLRAASAFP